MKEHEHATQNKPETEPSHDKVAKKAYAIYLKEGRPQGRDVQHWLEAEAKTPHAGPAHHAHMAELAITNSPLSNRLPDPPLPEAVLCEKAAAPFARKKSRRTPATT